MQEREREDSRPSAAASSKVVEVVVCGRVLLITFTPAPSEMKMLTLSFSSRIARRRAASFSRSIDISGT